MSKKYARGAFLFFHPVPILYVRVLGNYSEFVVPFALSIVKSIKDGYEQSDNPSKSLSDRLFFIKIGFLGKEIMVPRFREP